MTQIAEMVYNNSGIDLFAYTGPDGEKLERAFEFYADLYITGSSTAKGDYYSKEQVKMSHIFLYEIAAKRYPNNKKILEVLKSTDRTVGFDREVFGYRALLTHGLVIDQ